MATPLQSTDFGDLCCIAAHAPCDGGSRAARARASACDCRGCATTCESCGRWPDVATYINTDHRHRASECCCWKRKLPLPCGDSLASRIRMMNVQCSETTGQFLYMSVGPLPVFTNTCYLLVWPHAITALSRLAAHSLRVSVPCLPAGSDRQRLRASPGA